MNKILEKKMNYSEDKKYLFVTIWDTFQQGKLLLEILSDFYNNVYTNNILKDYFHQIPKEKSIKQEYSFIYKTLLGQESKFYDFKLNSEDFKLVPYEIINYRQDLMVKSFEKFNIPKYIINKIIEIELNVVDNIINEKVLGISNYKIDLSNFKYKYSI